MIHINSRDGHEMLTQEEFNRRHPGLAAALNAPRPFAEEGEELKKMRQAADMSVRELAKATGIRLGDASAIETGRVKATPQQEQAWRQATGHSLPVVATCEECGQCATNPCPSAPDQEEA
jgi:DNA-binding XRE family transcriptional regulator